MLSWSPAEVYWNDDADEAIVFNKDLSSLFDPIFEASSEPREDETWDIYGRCCDEIMPVTMLVFLIADVTAALWSYQEVRV